MRRVGRPVKSVLSREKILHTALELLNTLGPAKFSMSALAAELGVKPPALYHYVKNKQALLGGMREMVSGDLDTSGFAQESWKVAIERWARSYRTAFAAQPNAVALLATEPITGATRTLLMYEQVIQGFLAAGWEAAWVMEDLTALESFILGSALDAVAPEDMFDPGEDAVHTPSLLKVLQSSSSEAKTRADTAFESGLKLMIEGLLAKHHIAS